jgi:hypothetical protein
MFGELSSPIHMQTSVKEEGERERENSCTVATTHLVFFIVSIKSIIVKESEREKEKYIRERERERKRLVSWRVNKRRRRRRVADCLLFAT